LRLQLRRLIRHGRNGVILDEHLPRTPRSDASLDWEPDTPPGRKKPFGYQLKTAWKWMQFALSSRVIVHSNASAKFLSKRYHLALSKVVTIPYGVPVAPSAPFPPSGPLRVLLLAVVCFRKGHDVLIEATRYATTSWDVTFAGGGSQIETFRALAEERATQPIHFVGPLADPQGAIRDCDVLCVPSRSDASSISAIEAMMVGRPIVGSSADGVPEVFEDQETGLVVDVADPKDLAQALDALANRERREEMGRRARERALETRTLERMTEVTRREYRESARHG
jgi:glycosyltransferase involved in cell wall biosynthesis